MAEDPPQSAADGIFGVNRGSDYAAEELEFLRAVDAYKRLHRRPFPTLREYLAIARSLGYRKVAAARRPKRRRHKEGESDGPRR